MLQWMGGSRRKVTASRKSTQKRQQQFFEQRKRQHQQQDADALENHNDGPVPYAHQKGNRSLDILSLLNVPKVSEERKPACGRESTPVVADVTPCGRSFEAMDTKDYQSSMRSPIVVTDNVAAASDYAEPSRARTQMSHQEERVSSKSTWKNASNVRKAESKCWGIDPSVQTSILDIIGDDGPTNTSEEKPVNEAHVAFSVEGLGDLGSETPKQSPQQPPRLSCGDKSSFNKAAKKLQFRNNLNSMLDDLEMEAECYIQDPKEPTSGSPLDSFLMSEDVVSPLSYAEHEFSPVNVGKNLGGKRWEMNSLHEDRDSNFWNAGSSFLDDDIDSKNRGLDWKNGDANISRNVSPGFGFKEPELLPRSQEDITARYINLDEKDRHFRSLEEPSRHSSFMCDYKRQATRLSPYIDMEDRRNTSLSEESCSSTAARGMNFAGMPSQRHARRYGEDLPWQRENLHEEMQDIMTGATRRGEEFDRSTKYRRSAAGHTKSAYISQRTASDKFHRNDSWLHEEDFLSANTDWKNQHWARGRDPFGTSVPADLPNSSSYGFDIFENKTPDEFSPDNISLFRSFCPKKSFNSSFSRGDSYKESSRGIHHDINITVQSSHTPDVVDFFGDTEATFPVPELSAQGSVTEEVGDKLESRPRKITQISPRSSSTSQESKSTAGEIHIKENGSSLCKKKNGIHQAIVTNPSEEDPDETSAPVMVEDELDGELNTSELRRIIPGLCQQDLKVFVADIGGSVTKPLHDENINGFEAKATMYQPSCQVMTVERYVLQLFCVSQGNVAVWDTTKRLL